MASRTPVFRCGLIVALMAAAQAVALAEDSVPLELTPYSGGGSVLINLNSDDSLRWLLTDGSAYGPQIEGYGEGRFVVGGAAGQDGATIISGQIGLPNITLTATPAGGNPHTYYMPALDFSNEYPHPLMTVRIDYSVFNLFELANASAVVDSDSKSLVYVAALIASSDLARDLGKPELAGHEAGQIRFRLDLLGTDAAPVREPGAGAPEGGGPEGGCTPPAPLPLDIFCSRVGGSGSSYLYHGVVGSIRAFSTETQACSTPQNPRAQWFSQSSGCANHPLISANVYRLLNGRFEQIGQNCVKHSFCALDETTGCGTCPCPDSNCNYLAPGCGDTYTASRNGSTNLGLRSDINPQGYTPPESACSSTVGTHSHAAGQYHTPSVDNTTIRGRIQIQTADLGNAGAQYILEVQYITHEEATPERHNNCSYRRISTTTSSFTSLAATVAGQSAMQAWKTLDPSITYLTVDADGRFEVGYKVTDNGNGTWHYEYTIHNMNSHLSAQAFSLPIPTGVTLTNVGFKDINYHSGEIYNSDDWSNSFTGGILQWAGPTFAQNPNGNALRWGTSYNFRFDADRPPSATPGIGTLTMFRPGTPTSVTFNAAVPCADAASINNHPQDVTTCNGSSATFNVVAGGTGLNYQWRRGTTNLVNGGNITGATTDTLTIDPVGPADGATNYNCLVTNSCGSVASNNATLTVTTQTAPDAGSDQSICSGNTAALSGASNGGVNCTWSTSGDGSFADASSLSTTYTPGASDISTGSASLTLTCDAAAPCTGNAADSLNLIISQSVAIGTNPSDDEVCAGGQASFSVGASGGSLSYAWQRGMTPLTNGPTGNGSTISGATTATLVISSAAAADAASDYNCVVNNSCGSQTSSNAALVVHPGGSGDINGDTSLDGKDVADFVTQILSGGPPSPIYCAADMNGDGVVNDLDVGPFAAALVGP